VVELCAAAPDQLHRFGVVHQQVRAVDVVAAEFNRGELLLGLVARCRQGRCRCNQNWNAGQDAVHKCGLFHVFWLS